MIEVEENISLKSEEKQVRENKYRLRIFESCEDFVRSVLIFDMNRINNLKVKDLQVLLRYHFGLERLNGSTNKVELMEAVTELFLSDW